jgi:hypothetical protein
MDVLQYRDTSTRVAKIESVRGIIYIRRIQGASLRPEFSLWPDREREGLLFVSHPVAEINRKREELGYASAEAGVFAREFNWIIWRETRTFAFPKCWLVSVCAPHWLVAGIGLLLTALFVFAPRVLRLRRRLGRCAQCGYDLRGSPDKCPECGMVAGRGVAADVSSAVEGQ